MAKAIDRSDWENYCDRISEMLEGRSAQIEVSSAGLGHQIEADWRPLIGISYDPNDDIFDVALDGIDHIITRPRELRTDGEADVSALEIVDGDGIQHLIRLRDTPSLPAGH